MRRYVSNDEDSARWESFRHREGDIVVSTRSKSGTTWAQMICALLIHGPELPAPLGELSPWIDHAIEPADEVVARLETQPHRRVVKTHTPLDGIPLVAGTTYVVVGRHPLDLAVSLYHQGDNLDRDRIAQLTGVPARSRPRPALHDWLVDWTLDRSTPQQRMDSIAGVVHHADDAWRRARAGFEGEDVALLHYADLQADLAGEMRRLATRLDITVSEDAWPALVAAAGFDRMRDRAQEIVPNRLGVLRDTSRFFRAGRSGEGAATLTADELSAYDSRVAEMAPSPVVEWLHQGSVNNR